MSHSYSWGVTHTKKINHLFIYWLSILWLGRVTYVHTTMKQCCPLIVLLIRVFKGGWDGEGIGTFRPVWQPVEPIGWLQEEVPEQWHRRGTLCWSKYYSLAAPPPVYLMSSFHADPPHTWRLGMRLHQQDTCTTEGRDSHLKCAEVGKNPQFSRYSMVSCGGGGGRHLIYLCSPFINCDVIMMSWGQRSS